MFEAFLVTTSSEGLRPLGSAAQRSYELVSGSLRDRLGDRHANLFSEPVATSHGDRFDWYAPVTGKAVPLADLESEDQDTVREALGVLVQDILAEADRLNKSQSSQDQRLADALTNALEIPSDDMIYVVRDTDNALHPVMVNWAWARDGQQNVRGILTGLVPRHSAEPVTAFSGQGSDSGQAAARGFSWLWSLLLLLGWLLLGFILAAILYLLIEPCGLGRSGFFFCPEPAKTVIISGDQTRVLEDQVAALERELALQTRMCQPDYSSSEVPVTDKTELERRLKKSGAKQGDLGFSLIWNTKDDLDLQVTCPTEITVDFRTRSACNGTLDVDANVKTEDAVDDPVENIYFVDPVLGHYNLRVRLSQVRNEGPVSFTLRVTQRDRPAQTFTATVSKTQRDWKKTIGVSE